MALVQSGVIPITEQFPGATAAAAMYQHGLYPATAAAHLHPAIEAFSHLRPEEQAAILAAQQQNLIQAQAAQGQVIPQLIPGMVPPALLEQLMAQQQQQQQQAALANVVAAASVGGLAGPNIIQTDNILEVQRQYEALIAQVQKNPVLAQTPQFHIAVEQYRRIMQEHHMQQQQRMHEVMIQNSQQHLLLARVAGGPPEENASSHGGIRPGVIVHPNN